MDIEVSGVLGFVLLILDVWAIVRTVESAASTGIKVLWIVVILMLTGMGKESDQRASIEAGADECILKPFNPKLIQKRASEILEA